MQKTTKCGLCLMAVLLSASWLSACGLGGGGDESFIAEYAMIGTDGQPARGSDPGEINPGENLGEFTVNWRLRAALNEEVILAVTTLNYRFDNTNAVSCSATNRTDMSRHFNDNGGLPLNSRLRLTVCDQSCSSDGFDFNFQQPDCSSRSLPIVFR